MVESYGEQLGGAWVYFPESWLVLPSSVGGWSWRCLALPAGGRYLAPGCGFPGG